MVSERKKLYRQAQKVVRESVGLLLNRHSFGRHMPIVAL